MLFYDENVRHTFHRSSSLLQVVCGMLESKFAAHHYQLQVNDVQANDANTVTILSVVTPGKVEADVMRDVIMEINRIFRRKDGAKTVELHREDMPDLIHVMTTQAVDFQAAH